MAVDNAETEAKFMPDAWVRCGHAPLLSGLHAGPRNDRFRVALNGSRLKGSIPMSTGSEGIKPVSDADLPENSQENLDQKLDHAIEETFPTSDPVSVTITKGGAADPASARTASSTTVPKPLGRDGRNKATELKDRAADAVQSVAETATATVGDAVAEGRRRVRRARERYPEADRYIGAATRSVENPVTMLLVGIGLGYCLAWMIYGRRTRTAEQVPDYARTRQRYAPRE